MVFSEVEDEAYPISFSELTIVRFPTNGQGERRLRDEIALCPKARHMPIFRACPVVESTGQGVNQEPVNQFVIGRTVASAKFKFQTKFSSFTEKRLRFLWFSFLLFAKIHTLI